jgi:tetratricopeptide (TPR) repeat protein
LAYSWLGRCYLKQKKYAQGEEVFEKIINREPGNEKAYGVLAVIYKETGRDELAEECYKKIDILNSVSYNRITRNSYQKLKEILDGRGIRLVCVQYPLRGAEPLKKTFRSREGIIFIDNEKIFKDAVAKAGYKEYFEDIFAGDFGHCTPKGNRLLAEKIARAVIKELFNRPNPLPPS